jgi:hypothetical protein
MGKPGNQVFQHGALLGLLLLGPWGMAAMNTALASSPGSHSRAHAARSDSHPPLDLRPSVSTTAVVDKTSATAAFPSSLHRQTLRAQAQIDLPAMGAEGTQPRVPSRVEEFARRVHREGLPVARLWENKSALLSLGLNKKGKPGLWIVQKIR